MVDLSDLRTTATWGTGLVLSTALIGKAIQMLPPLEKKKKKKKKK